MAKRTPALTVFATLYNVAEYLPRFFECMARQTYKDYILLVIDDGSEDGTLEICRSHARRDSRIRVVHLDHVGIAAARNRAVALLQTPFAASVDGDDVYGPDYLRHLVEARDKYDADLAISRVIYRGEDYAKTGQTPARGELFIPRERFAETLPELLDDRRLNYLYAKLFKSELLRKTRVAEDVLQGSDTMFCCQYAVLANSIVLTDDADTNHIKYSSRSVTSCHGRDEFAVLCRIQSTITEIFRDAGFLTEKMQQAIDARVLQSGHWVLSSIARRAEPVGEALREAYGVVRSEAYTQAYGRYKQTRGAVGFPVVDPETVPAPEPLSGARIVVSMTSHPGRIRTVAPVLETIYAQTRMPDEVVLWLAEEQFPEKALPEELTALVEAGRLTVRWCGDLMPHKKYFYAFREYPDDLVITVDDDLLYAPTTIEQLYQSFLVHPRAVSALRAHLMLIENGRLLPYDDWLREFNLFAGEASMLLFATNGAGALFPPHLLRAELLDEEAIRQTCPYADDIWLKLMEIEADVPVVLAKPYAGLKYMPGTQEQTLYARYNRELNDAQLAAAIAWFDARYGEGCIMNRLAGYHDRLQGLRIIAAYHREKMEKKSAAIEKRDRKIEKLRSELTRLWGSRPMRIGRAATWPARALRGSFKKSP